MPSRARPAVAVAALALLAGCGQEGAPAGPPTLPQVSKRDIAAQESGKAVQGIIEDTAFVPQRLTVPVGGSVTWTNEDPFAHNVKAEQGDSFSSPDLRQGDTFTQKFDQAGTVHYICTIHPGMTGTVIVSSRSGK
jgi:plastocyanin